MPTPFLAMKQESSRMRGKSAHRLYSFTHGSTQRVITAKRQRTSLRTVLETIARPRFRGLETCFHYHRLPAIARGPELSSDEMRTQWGQVNLNRINEMRPWRRPVAIDRNRS